MGWFGRKFRPGQGYLPDGAARDHRELIQAGLEHARRRGRWKGIFFKTLDLLAQTGLGGPYINDETSNSTHRE